MIKKVERLVVIARHEVPKQSLEVILGLLRFARNDNLTKVKERSDFEFEI